MDPAETSILQKFGFYGNIDSTDPTILRKISILPNYGFYGHTEPAKTSILHICRKPHDDEEPET